MLSNEKSETAVIDDGKCGYIARRGSGKKFRFFTIDRNGEKV